MADKAQSQPLRKVNRYITDHNDQGVAVFSKDLSEELPSKTLGSGDKFLLGYATNEAPVDLSANKDLRTYQTYLTDPPGIIIPSGTVLRFVDMRPGGESPMHRTVSIDYAVVIEGEIELVLDSGEMRLMRRGDVAIQRGTMHLWRNASKTEWGRMMFVLQGAKPVEVEVDGVKKTLGEDFNGTIRS